MVTLSKRQLAAMTRRWRARRTYLESERSTIDLSVLAGLLAQLVGVSLLAARCSLFAIRTTYRLRTATGC